MDASGTTRTFGSDEPAPRALLPALLRGARGRCPECGQGRLFRGYLTVADECGHCGLDLRDHRADDAPPYVTIVIVGHIIVPLLLWVEQDWAPAMWLQFAFWLPLTLALTLALLRPVKGALIGFLWSRRMHGFAHDGRADPAAPQQLDIWDPAPR
ncbi:DUF983 domain-containing protein [Marinibaculum pumilum]|uniref:DUF983 domain-containing protein n=1 Tax=Marinibaculum pumilum TaxID=1766165 RepID=A0ABV7KW84_9PROT